MAVKLPPAEDLEDLYENAPCGYLSLDSDGCIFKANATFSEWIGFAPQDLIGRRLRDLFNIAGRIFYETHFAPLLRMQGFFNEVALDLVTADGTTLPVLVNARERRGEDGNLILTRLMIFNAKERRRYERQLVEAHAAALAARQIAEQGLNQSEISLSAERETAELREQFIAVLGHDLRNPLAAVNAGTRILLKEPQTDKALRVLGLMQTSTERMSALIDDVLDFARGRLGEGITLTRNSDAPLEPILRQVVEELRSAHPERVIEAQFALAHTVTCDHSRIGQLASNLIGNALAHGSTTQPVQVHASTSEAALTFWVANAGEPIPVETMARLFQPFFRGQVRPNQQGLGLGLHIASAIARAHGGTLTAASSAKETRFTFTMPRE